MFVNIMFCKYMGPLNDKLHQLNSWSTLEVMKTGLLINKILEIMRINARYLTYQPNLTCFILWQCSNLTLMWPINTLLSYFLSDSLDEWHLSIIYDILLLNYHFMSCHTTCCHFLFVGLNECHLSIICDFLTYK